MNRIERTLPAVLLVSLSLGLAGCFGTDDPTEGTTAGERPSMVKPAAVSALIRAGGCKDLLNRIQDDVIVKVEAQGELMKLGEEHHVGNGGFGRGGVDLGVADEAFAEGGAAPPSPMAPQDPGGVANDGNDLGGQQTSSELAGGPTGFSETNNQVAGVDEADIVKIDDGQRIYLLHGNDLFVLNSWPPSMTEMETAISIEGQATEMFVKDGTAVVFSTVYDNGDLIEKQKLEQEGDDYYDPYWNYYGSPFTKITQVDVNGDASRVVRELFIEGDYLSARRHGDVVRTVVRGGFRTPPIYATDIEYSDPWGREYPQEEVDRQVDAWMERMIAGVLSTELSDWLPTEREVIDGELGDPSRRCTDFFAPSPGLTNYGLTNIVSFDMTDPKSELGGALILGDSDQVYSNHEVVVLSQRDWRYDSRFIDHERTVLHTFDVKGDVTRYSASGAVGGHILDQFSMDERDGVLRVATTSQIWGDVVEIGLFADIEDEPVTIDTRRETDNRVVTLQGDEDGNLDVVGITKPLGHDGETIFSTRYVGDRAYVVTFRQTDPLIVVDLSDPAELSVLGELEIPGFSDYMHPLGDDHLLTIGRNADANGWDSGLLLQIFDVSDPTDPKQAHTYAYGPDGYSEANHNHKAFNFWRPAGSDDGLLAFPYVDYNYSFSSSLEVFSVSVEDGFSVIGSVDHTTMIQSCGGGDPYYDEYYYECGQPEVRRGLFIEDQDSRYVYSISYGGVLVHDIADLTTALATVQLPSPDYSDSRDGGYDDFGDVSTPPSSGGGFDGPMPTEPAPAPEPEPDPADGEEV